MFFTGFKMGFIVGGIFGGLMGSYYAIVYRTFSYIPMAALGSGCSFGFFMGIGMVMAVDAETAPKVVEYIESIGEKAYIIGKVEIGEAGVKIC